MYPIPPIAKISRVCTNEMALFLLFVLLVALVIILFLRFLPGMLDIAQNQIEDCEVCATSHGTNMEQLQRPGKLLTYRAAKRSKTGAFVYGFPIDEASISECIQKIRASSPELTANSDGKREWQADVVEAHAVMEHVQEACGTVWPLNRIRTVGCHNWEGGYVPVVGLVACDRPNEDYIPQGEDLKKLKTIMAGEGFEEGPRWFLLV